MLWMSSRPFCHRAICIILSSYLGKLGSVLWRVGDVYVWLFRKKGWLICLDICVGKGVSLA